MKKYLLAMLLTTSCYMVSQAQKAASTASASTSGSKFSLGPVAGLGWSTVSNIDNSKFKLGFNLGLATVYSAAEHFGIGLDVKYAFVGAKWNDGGENEMDLHYLQIPLKAIYFFNNYGDKIRPKIFAGPSLSILSSAKINNPDGTTVDAKNYTSSVDLV